MEFTAKDVAKLRELTGAGFADCRNALASAKTLDEAVKALEEKGQARAEKMKTAVREQLAQDPEVLKRPEKLRAQIVEGKLKKQLAEQVLLEQPWVKDEKVTVGKLVDDVIRKTGENVVVRRFARFALGEE